MNCHICKHGHLKPGHVTVTLERPHLTLVFKQVPALVCENCGESLVDEAVSAQLLAEAEAAAQSGVQVEIRTFVAA